MQDNFFHRVHIFVPPEVSDQGLVMGPAAGDGWDWFISYRHLTHYPGLSLRIQTNSHLESGHEGDEGVHLPSLQVIHTYALHLI